MMNQCAEDHFRWIGTMADRIICAKNPDNELPLLSLSFLKNNNILNFLSQFSRPVFPITIEKLLNAKLYGIVVSAVVPSKEKNSQILFNFEMILNRLKDEGYIPQKPCDKCGLENGVLTHHLNLCKSIEFAVVDRSLNINLLKSDLNRLPRSFYTLRSDKKIFHLEDAISLWLSKFHCIADFSDEADPINYEKSDDIDLNDKLYTIQMDASKFSKIAACLSRAFPEKIDKDVIMNGDDEDDIEYNIKLAKSVLDEYKAFVIERFPTDEHLFTLFIADLFYLTRSGIRKFVVFDHPILYEPHLPGDNRSPRSPRCKRGFSSKINLNYFLSGPIDGIEGRKEGEEYEMDEAREEEIYNIITPYGTLQDIKDDEEFNMDDAREEEIYNIITPHNTLQDIKDGEEYDMADAREEERYNIITPHGTLQNIKDNEEYNMDDAREEEKYNIITPYGTLQNIKDDEEYNMDDAKDEEKYNIITPYNTLQDIKDGEEAIIVDEKDEDKYKTLQDIKDEEESKLHSAVKEFSGLLEMSTLGRQKMRKIVRPIVTPKGTKN